MPAALSRQPAVQRRVPGAQPWPSPVPLRYGEALVQAVLHELATLQPEVLLLPAPDAPDPEHRALSLSALEAARRHGRGGCAWLAADTDDSTHWVDVAPAELNDRLPALFAGLHRQNAAALPREAGATASVSLIVRSMDRASLSATLDSIALQTVTPLEVVLVNARGKDHSPLPSDCGGAPVVMVATADGSRLPRPVAANRGLEAAGGAQLLFLDDDDVLLPDHLSRLVQALAAAPQAVAAYAGVEMGRPDAQGHWQTLHRFDSPFDRTRLLFENYLPIHAVLFRRRADTAALRVDESFDLFEDWDFWLQLVALGDFVHVPGISARYRVTEREHSNVFADSDDTRDARARLFAKWQQRLDTQQFSELLRRSQSLFRETAQQRAQLDLLLLTEIDLRGIVAAREHEIADAQELGTGLQQMLGEREREIADLRAGADDLRALLAARMAETAAAVRQVNSLQQVLEARQQELSEAARQRSDLQTLVGAREAEVLSLRAALQAREQELEQTGLHLSALHEARQRELADAALHAGNLSLLLKQRESELSDAAAHAQNLGAALAARDAEIADLQQVLAEQSQALSVNQVELQRLHSESPAQAVMRTLRKKKHGTQSG